MAAAGPLPPSRSVKAPEVDPIDATGAGDAFAGALAWTLHDGRSTVDAARVAVAASTVAVTGFGSQEAYPHARPPGRPARSSRGIDTPQGYVAGVDAPRGGLP